LSPKIFSLSEDSVLKMSIRLIDILWGLLLGRCCWVAGCGRENLANKAC
jgi:hypothetical protein